MVVAAAAAAARRIGDDVIAPTPGARSASVAAAASSAPDGGAVVGCHLPHRASGDRQRGAAGASGVPHQPVAVHSPPGENWKRGNRICWCSHARARLGHRVQGLRGSSRGSKPP